MPFLMLEALFLRNSTSWLCDKAKHKTATYCMRKTVMNRELRCYTNCASFQHNRSSIVRQARVATFITQQLDQHISTRFWPVLDATLSCMSPFPDGLLAHGLPHPNWARLQPEQTPPDQQQPWQTLSQHVLSHTSLFVADQVRLHGGGETRYLYHPRGLRAVFVLPVTDDAQGVLIRQYRYPLRDFVTEVVAGGVEAGEDLLSAAQRELQEEVGGVAAQWHALPGFFAQPSLSGTAFFPWLALGVTLQEANNEDSELIERLTLPLSEVYRRLDAGEIANGPSALVLYQARRALHQLGLLP